MKLCRMKPTAIDVAGVGVAAMVAAVGWEDGDAG